MITIEQYFGTKIHTLEQQRVAADLLEKVNALCAEAEADGVVRQTCPNTGTMISGSKGGSGDGGFRLPDATTGAKNSSHKVLPADNPAGAGVDVYAPGNHLDHWLNEFEEGDGKNSKLREYGLAREHPGSTSTWCHLTNRLIGRETFLP